MYVGKWNNDFVTGFNLATTLYTELKAQSIKHPGIFLNFQYRIHTFKTINVKVCGILRSLMYIPFEVSLFLMVQNNIGLTQGTRIMLVVMFLCNRYTYIPLVTRKEMPSIIYSLIIGTLMIRNMYIKFVVSKVRHFLCSF